MTKTDLFGAKSQSTLENHKIELWGANSQSTLEND